MGSEKDIIELVKILIQVLEDINDKHLPSKIAQLIKNYSRWAIVLGIGIGWIPFIGYLMAIFISAIFIWSMYSSINSKLQIPFINNAIWSILIGMSVNIIVAIVIGFFVELFLSFIPIAGSFADMALTAVICYYAVWTSGFLYLKALTKVLKKK